MQFRTTHTHTKDKVFLSFSSDAILFTMSDLPNKVISVFLEKQALTLKDSEISLSLVAQGTQCYTENVRRIAQNLSPSLFLILINPDKSMTITVEPKVYLLFCQ